MKQVQVVHVLSRVAKLLNVNNNQSAFPQSKREGVALTSPVWQYFTKKDSFFGKYGIVLIRIT